MKPILFLAGALLAGAASAGLTVLFVQPGAASERSAPAGPAGVSPETPEDLEGLRGEVAMLTRTVGELQTQVERLRQSQMREPVAALDDAGVTPESLAAAGLTPVQIEERMREVFAAEREREEEQRDAEQAERTRAMAERQAERIAEELNLSPGDQSRLAAHLLTAGEKRRELFEGMRDGGFDRDAMRASMEELRAWNTEELYRTFSPAVAAQLEEMGGDVFGGRGPGGRRGGFGGPGGDNPPGGG